MPGSLLLPLCVTCGALMRARVSMHFDAERGVCGVSTVPYCSGKMTHPDAVKFCSREGLRLCAADEVHLAEGTGCGYDSEMVWTNTPCYPHGPGFVVAPGRANNEGDLSAWIPEKCVYYGFYEKNVVRCCANAICPQPYPTPTPSATPSASPSASPFSLPPDDWWAYDYDYVADEYPPTSGPPTDNPTPEEGIAYDGYNGMPWSVPNHPRPPSPDHPLWLPMVPPPYEESDPSPTPTANPTLDDDKFVDVLALVDRLEQLAASYKDPGTLVVGAPCTDFPTKKECPFGCTWDNDQCIRVLAPTLTIVVACFGVILLVGSFVLFKLLFCKGRGADGAEEDGAEEGVVI
jgi:hypothetical protein